MFKDFTGWAIVITVAHGYPKHNTETSIAFGKTKNEMFDILKTEKSLIYNAIIYYVVDGIAEEVINYNAYKIEGEYKNRGEKNEKRIQRKNL